MANTTYSIMVPATPTSSATGTSVGAARKELRTFMLAGPSPGDEVTILGSQDNTNFQVVTDGNGQPLILTYGTPTRTINDNSLYYRTNRQGFGAGSTLAAVQMCGEDLTSSSSVNSTAVTSGSYTVGANDSSIDVNFAGAVAITLPAPSAGRLLRLHDVGGLASPANAITATAASGSTIDNQATVYITGAWESIVKFDVAGANGSGVELTVPDVKGPFNGGVVGLPPSEEHGFRFQDVWIGKSSILVDTTTAKPLALLTPEVEVFLSVTDASNFDNPFYGVIVVGFLIVADQPLVQVASVSPPVPWAAG